MNTQQLVNLSSVQLRRALALKVKIEALESELAAILSTPTSAAAAALPGTTRKSTGKRMVSSKAQAPIAAKPTTGRRKMSAVARARIAAAAKARWAKVKAAGKKSL